MTSSPLERLCAHRGFDVLPDGELLDLAPVLIVTGSAQSTINAVMTDHRLPSAPRLLLIAAAVPEWR